MLSQTKNMLVKFIVEHNLKIKSNLGKSKISDIEKNVKPIIPIQIKKNAKKPKKSMLENIGFDFKNVNIKISNIFIGFRF